MTLPTYVHKATAVRRSVRTIDLDATGVWTSGRTDEDARIAQASAKRVARSAAATTGRRSAPDPAEARVRFGTPPGRVLCFRSCRAIPGTPSGAVAQLVARLVRNEKVRGSNPLSSTKCPGQGRCPSS